MPNIDWFMSQTHDISCCYASIARPPSRLNLEVAVENLYICVLIVVLGAILAVDQGCAACDIVCPSFRVDCRFEELCC
jgi:hypothetical protein